VTPRPTPRAKPKSKAKAKAKPKPKAPTVTLPRHSPSLPGADAALARVRAICLALPDVEERPSHGAPTFFVRGKRAFVNFVDNHHHDGKLALWCAAPPGFQASIVDTAPDRYYVPAYVGHLGWVGVRLDRGTSWDEIAAVIERAYRAVVDRAR
jgi:hypothetical protein